MQKQIFGDELKGDMERAGKAAGNAFRELGEALRRIEEDCPEILRHLKGGLSK